MRTTFFFLLAFGLSALADATFSSPKSGDKWSKGKSQMISWDSSSLSSGNCDIHLVPAGAKDTTTIITEVALQVSNSGSYSWTPSSSISVAEAEIIIVDSKKTSIISSVFTLIMESSDSSGKDSGSYNNGHDNSGTDSGSYNNGYDNSGKDSGSNNNGYDNSGKDSGSYNNGYDNSGKNSSSNNNGYDNGGSKSTKSKSYETNTKATMNLYTHASYMKTYESKGHETKTETETETKGGEYTKSLETVSTLISYHFMMTDSTSDFIPHDWPQRHLLYGVHQFDHSSSYNHCRRSSYNLCHDNKHHSTRGDHH
jgi:hypothetical protein